MLEFRPEVDTYLLEQTRVNCAGFDEVDYSNNLLHHCRKSPRQMLRSKVFTVKKTVDDLDIRIESCHLRDGVVVRASASQSVDLGFISQVESYQKI